MFRSQLATAIYNHQSTDGSLAFGYGTNVAKGGGEGRKLSSFPELQLELEFMKEKGMDISNECCKQITPEALKDASKIILMSEPEYVPEWLKDYDYEFWEVSNPTTHTLKILQETYDLLSQKITKLID